LPLPFGGVGGGPEVDRLGGLTLAIVRVGAAAGLVAGGGAAGAGGGDGCGDGDGGGAGDGAGRGFGCGRARRLAGGTAAAATTAVLGDDGPSTTGANGLAARTPRAPNGVTAAAGENADTTERCCAAGSPSPPDDDWPT
jgi:hypothetical protein